MWLVGENCNKNKTPARKESYRAISTGSLQLLPELFYTVLTGLSSCAGGLLPPASCTVFFRASVFPGCSFSLHFPSFSTSASLLLRKPPTPSPPQAPAPAGCCHHPMSSRRMLHISLLPRMARPVSGHGLQCGGQDLSAGLVVQCLGWWSPFLAASKARQ